MSYPNYPPPGGNAPYPNYTPPPPPASGSLVPGSQPPQGQQPPQQYQPQGQQPPQQYPPQGQYPPGQYPPGQYPPGQQPPPPSPGCYAPPNPTQYPPINPQYPPQYPPASQGHQDLDAGWKNFVNQYQQGPPPKKIQIQVNSSSLLSRFPVQLSIDDNQFLQEVIRQACLNAGILENTVKELKIKPEHSKQQFNKAQILQRNIPISQIASTHQRGNEKLQLHLDIIPQVGTAVTISPKIACFDYTKLDALKNNPKQFGETVCAMLNGDGGSCLIGVGKQNNTILGIELPPSKQEIQQIIVSILKDHIHPPVFQSLIKSKSYQLCDFSGGPTRLSGIVVEVMKCPKNDIAFTYDYVFFHRKGNENLKAYPHEITNILRERKGKQVKQFVLTFGF